MASPRLSPVAIDRKIHALERELAQLRQCIAFTGDRLQTLRAARAILRGDKPSRRQVASADGAKALWLGVTPGSLLAATIEILREAGHALHVTELQQRLNATSRRQTDLATLVGTVARGVRRGKLRRTAPNVYALRHASALLTRTKPGAPQMGRRRHHRAGRAVARRGHTRRSSR